ncbi:APC family permease [Paenibacillus xerothermodurans]|uniref:Amino acid permease n=1 Tax=Paenibacillus xerothermodurans TaxID=1977292 RepID=A0A2W1NRN6_PAEXE|nr:amino acid permease [Paenibacillus xerothermodurans]PZE21543.1 amino acid permease [Paenibacillus xerothermodurans]
MSLVMGTVIGSGIFMKPGTVIEYAGNSTLALIAWVLGGIITIAGGLTIAEVSVQIPKTGGLYVYLEQVYGKIWGYLCGWMQTIFYGPAIIGALGLYFGILTANLFSLPEYWDLPFGIGAIVFLAVVNSIGTRYGGSVQLLTTVAKFVPIILIIVMGIWKGNEQVLGVDSGLTGQLGMGAAVLATLWAYDGWMMLGFVAGEMKNPAKHLPIAIVGGLSIVTAAYVLINVALLHVLPAADIAALDTTAASTAASILLGNTGGKLISIGILISIFGCLNGKILTFPRVPFAMAERGQLPFSKQLRKVHPKFGTPVAATVMQVILAVILMVFTNPDYLSEMSIFVVYLFYILAFIAVFLLRKRNQSGTRAYSVPLYPFVPVVAILGSLFIIYSTLQNQVMDCLFAIALTLIGLPIYYVLEKKQAHSETQGF